VFLSFSGKITFVLPEDKEQGENRNRWSNCRYRHITRGTGM